MKSLFTCAIDAVMALGFILVFAVCERAYSVDSHEYFEKTIFAPENPAFGQLVMDAEWRIWIPAEVKTLRGVIVHQHGCGDGSCDGARTAVYDLQWQELARKHDCALMAVSYRQGEFACEMWCDPRNGSAQSFLDALKYFAEYTGHDELTRIPWALWGHSGGGHWVGSMCQMYPERVVGAWLRSGCPDTVGFTFDDLPFSAAVLDVPMMLNIGKHEVSFLKIVWNSCWPYYAKMRAKGAKIGFIVDPGTSHETGNSRLPAIKFLDECLSLRLLEEKGSADLLPPPNGFVLAIDDITDQEIGSCSEDIPKESIDGIDVYSIDERRAFLKDGLWFLNKEYVDCWRKYSIDCSFEDLTPPPCPTNVAIDSNGLMTWSCRADLESGLKTFIIYCDGEKVCELEGAPVCNSRPLFQGLMYSDTPDFSLKKMEYQIEKYDSSRAYSIVAVNTCDLVSAPVLAQAL